MSWWVSLNSWNPETHEIGGPVEVERFVEGGTLMLGGSVQADLNITYNYSHYFHEALDTEKGLKWLSGRTAAETVVRLEAAVAALGTEPYTDYWEATPGNAGFALSILLAWARKNPEAVWEVH